MVSSKVFNTRWDLQWYDVYAAAMHCKTCTDGQWDVVRMDCHPSESIEFCDIVTPEVLRDMHPEVIREMAEGFVCML